MTPEATVVPDAPMSPADELATFTAWATAVFYLAESDHNPSVRTYFDAYHYIATSLSVGYGNIFPVTQVGKMVAAAVMMLGPALATRVFNAGSPEDPNKALIAKLDEILVELRRSHEAKA